VLRAAENAMVFAGIEMMWNSTPALFFYAFVHSKNVSFLDILSKYFNLLQ
jgi:hypothetical protein